VLGGTPEGEAAFMGRLVMMRTKGRQPIMGVFCTWCLLYLVYAVLSGCYTQYMLYAEYAVLRVCCTYSMVYSVYGVVSV
jgi:hypothetical protein